VRLTVLGKSPSWPDAGGACSGYLVEDENTCLLLDCGSGVLAQLRLVRDYDRVDAVVISHMHADHFFDLVPYACALRYGPRKPATPPALLLPPGGREIVRAITSAAGQHDVVGDAFAAREYDVAATERAGTLRLRFAPVPHFVPANAVEVVSGAGPGRLTFGADCGPSQALSEFARGTDLLLLEATLREPEPAGRRGHLTPAEAGALATGARAARLVLTHISDELDEDWALAEAQRAYAGPVEIARAGAEYAV
jgi:ribonuclease BN (tRNA processing enzyme)